MPKFVFAAIALLLLCFITSCQVEKRVHRKGYHVQWHKGKVNKRLGLAATQKVEKQETPQVLTEKPVESPNEDLLIADLSTDIYQERPGSSMTNFQAQHDESQIEYFTINTEIDCDVIIMRNGEEIQARILELSEKEIKYKKCGLESGPNIIINRSEVDRIIFGKDIEIKTEPPTHDYSVSETKFDELGLVSFLLGLPGFFFAGILFGPAAVIMGIISMNRNAENPEKYTGKAFGVIGLILGLIVTAIMIMVLMAI